MKFYVCSQVQQGVPRQVHHLLNRFLHSCGLIIAPPCTSSSASQLASQVYPSFQPQMHLLVHLASLYRSRGTLLGVPSDKPSVASSIALKNACSSVRHQVQRQIFPFCHLLLDLQWFLKVNPNVHFWVQHQVHHQVHFLVQPQVQH